MDAWLQLSETLIVIGGKDETGNHLKSVENFRFDRFTWEKNFRRWTK
jgi:hypothetical protein